LAKIWHWWVKPYKGEVKPGFFCLLGLIAIPFLLALIPALGKIALAGYAVHLMAIAIDAFIQ